MHRSPPVVSMHASSPVDFSFLEEAADGEREFVIEVLQTFLQDSFGRVGRIQFSIDTQDWVQLKKEAHTLKGSSGSVGANQLAQYSLFLMECAKNGDIFQAREIMRSLQQEYNAVTTIIRHYIAQ